MATYVSSSSSAGGIGFFGLVYAGIILAKVFGFVDWSWFNILLPFTIVFGIIVFCFVAYLLILLVEGIYKKYKK